MFCKKYLGIFDRTFELFASCILYPQKIDAEFEPWSVDTKTITCQSDTGLSSRISEKRFIPEHLQYARIFHLYSK